MAGVEVKERPKAGLVLAPPHPTMCTPVKNIQSWSHKVTQTGIE